MAWLNRAVVSGRIIPYLVAMMLAIMLAAALIVHVLSPKAFDTFGDEVWWAAQTVTTVGYGDITPTTVWGRLIATVVMISGIGFLTVVTASITAVFVEAARRRLGAESDRARDVRFDEIEETLARIEAALGERRPN